MPRVHRCETRCRAHACACGRACRLFDDNQLTGPLPREWGAMTSLQHLCVAPSRPQLLPGPARPLCRLQHAQRMPTGHSGALAGRARRTSAMHAALVPLGNTLPFACVRARASTQGPQQQPADWAATARVGRHDQAAAAVRCPLPPAAAAWPRLPASCLAACAAHACWPQWRTCCACTRDRCPACRACAPGQHAAVCVPARTGKHAGGSSATS
jgi:hypothetical protein